MLFKVFGFLIILLILYIIGVYYDNYKNNKKRRMVNRENYIFQNFYINDNNIIDRIIINDTGIYCINNFDKDYNIIGDVNSEKWTAYSFEKTKEKLTFNNPIIENENNINELRKIINNESITIYNCVVVNDDYNCMLNTDDDCFITSKKNFKDDFDKFVRSHEAIFSKKALQNLNNKLKDFQMFDSKMERKS